MEKCNSCKYRCLSEYCNLESKCTDCPMFNGDSYDWSCRCIDYIYDDDCPYYEED